MRRTLNTFKKFQTPKYGNPRIHGPSGAEGSRGHSYPIPLGVLTLPSVQQCGGTLWALVHIIPCTKSHEVCVTIEINFIDEKGRQRDLVNYTLSNASA